MKIGWIGLGKMGLPIAQRLAAAGHEVVVFARNEAGSKRAEAAGFGIRDSIQAVANDVDLVISAISDDEALRAIAMGQDGLAEVMAAGQTYIDLSTVSPEASRAVAKAFATRGVNYLRAPVSGSTALAETGTLTVMVSGPHLVYDRLQPLFAAFSRKSFYLGDDEQARIIKLVVNTLVAATSALLAEALAFGRKGGLDLESAMEVISQSAVASPLIEYKRKVMLEGAYNPNFTVSQMMKDLDIVLSVGRSSHVPMPLTALIREQYESAFVNGNGELDFFVLVKEMAERAGL